MISKKMIDALNKQLNNEMFASYSYLAMAAYFDATHLKGCAKWMEIQSQEEMEHVRKFYTYILDRDGEVTLDSIKKPTSSWKSPKAAFEAALKNEMTVTKDINALVDLAIKENDHATHQFLQWFVAEQVEEESSIRDVVEKLDFAGDSHSALLMIDSELGGRTSA